MVRFINDATVSIPKINFDLTKRKECYLSDNDIITRDFKCAFDMYKYFNFNEVFMSIFGAEYSRVLAWHSSKLKDVVECHEASFYDALMHALSITGQNDYLDLIYEVFNDVVLLYKNTGSFKEPMDRKMSKPFDVEVFLYKNNVKEVIWQHSYR